MASQKKNTGEYYVYPDGSVTRGALELEGYPIVLVYQYVGNSKKELKVEFADGIDAGQLEKIISTGNLDKEAKSVLRQMLEQGRIKSGLYEVPRPENDSSDE